MKKMMSTSEILRRAENCLSSGKYEKVIGCLVPLEKELGGIRTWDDKNLSTLYSMLAKAYGMRSAAIFSEARKINLPELRTLRTLKEGQAIAQKGISFGYEKKALEIAKPNHETASDSRMDFVYPHTRQK